jgi:uncharacterized membrane protein YkvA (DUF1232 family)
MAKKVNKRREAHGILRGALMLIPNLIKLLARLFKDPRVPLAEKAIVIGAIVYAISPLDILPDVIPFVGQIDDLYLISITILRLFSRTSDEVIYEHWDGSGDLVKLIHRIERAARQVLPERIQKILLGRVEIAPKIKGGLISSPAEEVKHMAAAPEKREASHR